MIPEFITPGNVMQYLEQTKLKTVSSEGNYILSYLLEEYAYRILRFHSNIPDDERYELKLIATSTSGNCLLSLYSEMKKSSNNLSPSLKSILKEYAVRFSWIKNTVIEQVSDINIWFRAHNIELIDYKVILAEAVEKYKRRFDTHCMCDD